MCMVLIPPTERKGSGKEAGPLVRLLGGLAFVLVMWGLLVVDLLRRGLR